MLGTSLRTGTAGALLTALAAIACGCGSELETGYKYRPLNSSETQRRAFYASPYSPEKTAADQEKQRGHDNPLSAAP